MARENKSRFALLGFLMEEPLSGYDIKLRFERRTIHFWQESFGQIYPQLKGMTEEGLLTREGPAGTGRGAKAVYTITEKGRQVFTEWMKQPYTIQPIRNELLLKMTFGRHVSLDILEQHLTEDMAGFEEQLKHYQAIETDLLERMENHPDLKYWQVNLGYGKAYAAFRKQWSQEALEILRKGEKPQKEKKP